MKATIYFDYAATTPVDPRVAEKMSECDLGRCLVNHLRGTSASPPVEAQT